MSSKSERKIRRVIDKVSSQFPHIQFFCDTTSDEARNCKHLLLCNFGATSGATRESIVDIFTNGGPVSSGVESVSLLPRKSYSFVTMRNAGEAADAHERLNGVEVNIAQDPGKKVALYIALASDDPRRNSDEDPTWEIPEGVRIVEEFVSEAEEEEILGSLSWDEKGSVEGGMKHRQVQHFGYDFVYGSNSIEPDAPNGRPLPAAGRTAVARAVDAGHLAAMPDQCTVNRYLPGQGIPPHIDTHSCCDGQISSLSLGSDVVMNFSDGGGEEGSGESYSVLLPRRSLMVMSGRARYALRHSIVTRKSDVVPAGVEGGLTVRKRGTRTSLTFRKVLRGPCDCSFPKYCDSRIVTNSAPEADVEAMARAEITSLERLHVHDVYESIAGHFSETRHSPWPNVSAFLHSLPSSAVVLDVGCGNGKYLGARRGDCLQIGCDFSENLVRICADRGLLAVRADCLSLPFKSGAADAVVSIAVIHHLGNAERRRNSLMEMLRVLRVGGRCLVYVWARDQRRGERNSTYLSEKKTSKVLEDQNEESHPFGLPVHTNRSNFKHSDLLVPWKRKGEDPKMFHRFYHVFEEGELEAMVSGIPRTKICDSYYDQGNWCIVFEKI